MARSLFPYLGTWGDNADKVVEIVRRLLDGHTVGSRRIVDLTAGGCSAIGELAYSGGTVVVNDGNYYSFCNAHSIFVPASIARVQARIDYYLSQKILPETTNPFPQLEFGYWSPEFRERVGAIIERGSSLPASDFLLLGAATSRVLMDATYRGVDWADKMADGTLVKDLGIPYLRDRYRAVLQLIGRRRSGRVRFQNRVTRLDFSRVDNLVDLVHSGDIVLFDPPLPTSSRLGTSGEGEAFAWFDSINSVVSNGESEEQRNRYAPSTAELKHLLNILRDLGATVVFVKQTGSAPETHLLRDYLGDPTAIMPIRGKRGKAIDLNSEYEEAWILPPSK